MKLLRDNYTALLITCSVILLLVANAILGFVLTNQSKTAMKTLIHSRMTDISKTAASMLNGDELKRLKKEDYDTPEYQKGLKTLAYFQENIELEYIYCIQPPVNGEFKFSIDPTVIDPGEFGSPIVTTEALKRAAEGVTAVDDEPYEDAWGRFYSAYSPVFASDGSLAAIVAVDFSAKWYDDEIARQEHTIIICIVLALFMCILLIFLATRLMRKKVETMTADIFELSKDLKELTQEFSSDKNALTDDGEISLGSLGERILMVKDALKRHIDDVNSKANKMITALSSDYRSVYYVDLDTDEAICYQASKDFPIELAAGDKFSFSNAMKAYCENFMAEEQRKNFYEFVDTVNIKCELSQKRIISHVYLANIDGREVYKMLKIAGARHPENRDDNKVHAVGVGFTDIDEETRKTMERNETLKNALEAAKSANIAKTVFLSNMSHEIRTPMNAIIGLNSIALMSENLPADVKEQLEKVDSSAKHLLALINDILDVSRIESGKVTVKEEKFSLKLVLEQVDVIIGGQCKDKGLKYVSESERHTGYYIGDAMKLRQILINILGNAVKFTDVGGSVTLKAEETQNIEGIATLKFTMSDTGKGMSEEFLPKLFDAFSQEGDTPANRYGSTGLGMTITKSFVDLMQGNIEVTSKLGVGTTFTVTVALPKVSLPVEEETKPQDVAQASETTLEGKKILLAEDMPVNAEIALAILEMGGAMGEHAENGQIAVEKFEASEKDYYSAILMDMRMPVMDGLTAAKAIRASNHPNAKTIPIIALTANAFDEDIKESIKAGINAHLSKPINPDEIFKTLKELIK